MKQWLCHKFFFNFFYKNEYKKNAGSSVDVQPGKITLSF